MGHGLRPSRTPVSLNDPAAIDAFLGGAGTSSSSGVRVTRETALAFAPWWAAVRLIAGDVAKLPLRVYRKGPEGKTPDAAHPASYLLEQEPNEYTDDLRFKELLTAHALHVGGGYAYIDRDGAARPTALLPLNPERVIPAREGGRSVYVLELDGGERRKLPGDDVLHICGFGWDGVSGYNVYEKARETIGLGVAEQRFESVFFRNNARPNVAVQVPRALNETQRQDLRETWNRIHQGLENQHRLALLENGATLQQFSINARDAQLLEGRLFAIRDVARFFGLPPHKLGDTSGANYNTLEQENLAYLTCLRPWCLRWQKECRRKLLREEEKRSGSRIVLFDLTELYRSDLATMSNYNRTALGGAPWETVSEVRERMGLDPTGNPEDDEVAKPLAMSSGQPPEPDDDDAPPPRRKKPTPEDDAGATTVLTVGPGH